MSDNSSNSPRPVSTVDAKSIQITKPSPVNQGGAQPIGSSPEEQEQSIVDHHPENPAGEQLLENYIVEVTSGNDSTARSTASALFLTNAKPSSSEITLDQGPRGKRRQYLNPLIKQLQDGVNAGDITEPINAHSLAKWMCACNIRKGDGTEYKSFNAGSFLSSSYIGKKNKTNRNSVWLDRRKNEDGIYEYWFSN